VLADFDPVVREIYRQPTSPSVVGGGEEVGAHPGRTGAGLVACRHKVADPQTPQRRMPPAT